MNAPARLLPRFTIRWLLLMMVVVAFISLVISRALQGNSLAIGFSMALAGGIFLLGVQAVVFLAAGVLRVVFRGGAQATAGESPFGTSPIPTQVVAPPRDSD